MTHKSYSPYRGYAIFLLPGVVLFLAVIVFPFLANIAVSFTRWRGTGDPIWIGLDNYVRAFGDAVFWSSFRNNVVLLVGLVTIPTIIGLVLAVVLFDFVGKRFGNTVASLFRAGLYLPQIIPVVVAAIIWRWVYQPDWGVFNTIITSLGGEGLNWLGSAELALPSVLLMLIWFQIGYPLVIIMAGLQRIDPELYEAASIDGANWSQRMFSITLPLIRPELYVVILTTMIYSLKTFAPIFAMTRGGPGNSTMVASYFAYKNFFENSNVGYGSTMATVLTVVIIVITIFYIRLQTRQEQREGL
ncbi:MAG: sugar ABC transporter permease [Chloroflexi bacterium]|nr:sugar ABC transporter permease [Chloroflexota bacterium]